MSGNELPSFSEWIGIFPLPNAVLLPGANLPLQVYEPRYRTMVRDALAGQQVIAMALLQPDHEAHYFTNQADVHPVVGVGRIQECLKVPDGRYLLNLRGLCRARIRQEDRDGEYWVAMLDPMLPPQSTIEQDGEFAARYALRELVQSTTFDQAPEIEIARRDVASEMPLSDTVDRLAASLLPPEAVDVKQRLLEEIHPTRRAQTLLGELKSLGHILETRQRNLDQWPRLGSMN